MELWTVLLDLMAQVGLDSQRARAVLQSDSFAQKSFYTRSGIHCVPAVILNGQHLISGG